MQPRPSDVDAVLVTRGDVDLSRIEKSLAGFKSIIVWNNSVQDCDQGPYGQYVAARNMAHSELVYFQDDDCVVEDPGAVVGAWETGLVVCNVPSPYREQYEGRADKLMGFGSCFERSLIEPTFTRYFSRWPKDALVLREAMRVFTSLNRTKLVSVDFEHLPWASAPNRLYRQPDHLKNRDEICRRTAELRRIAA